MSRPLWKRLWIACRLCLRTVSRHMRRLHRLNRLENLLNIEEKQVLAEFKQVRHTGTAIKKHIYQLEHHRRQAGQRLLKKPVSTGQLHVARSFSQTVAAALTELNARLEDNEKKFAIAGDNIRHVRSRIKSVQRLINKYQAIENHQQENHAQKEIETNLNYSALK